MSLAVQLHIDLARLGVEADVVVRVSDRRDHLAGDFFIIDLGRGGDFAGHRAVVGRDQRFAGHAAVRVLRQQGIQHAVGNLIGQLVGMAHAHRFARKQVLSCGHVAIS